MKNYYKKPIITVEELEKADVLLVSEQTDNTFVRSEDLVKENFSADSLL